jgi:hypothetical protein
MNNFVGQNIQEEEYEEVKLWRIRSRRIKKDEQECEYEE